MSGGDFYGSEQSAVVQKAGKLRIELTSNRGEKTVLKDGVGVKDGDVHRRVVDEPPRAARVLREADRRRQGQGRAAVAAPQGDDDEGVRSDHVRPRRRGVLPGRLRRSTPTRCRSSASSPNNGIGDLYAKIQALPAAERAAIEADLAGRLRKRGRALAMVDSSKGITNLHVPSDVIIDASMPAAIRASGQMWGPDGKLHDMKAMIPDRCYAGIYQAVIDDCRKNGAFDVPTMGTVSNVGLMAQKAEEYGSHDKTFEIAANGTVRVVDADGKALIEHRVEHGDIWRMCQTKDLPIRDWVKLAVNRARATGHAAIFWLDENRAYDRNVIDKVAPLSARPRHERASTSASCRPSTRSARR